LSGAWKKAGSLLKRKQKLTDEGKRQDMILSLKSRIHTRMTDLGARVYHLIGSNSKNPALDATVKALVAQIRMDEVKIASLMKKAAGRQAA
jgi:hypothetical protein